ncbi:MAG: hypothetical protein LBD73_00400, partial [Deferribacteraceae bacterium]|nr:hypothetical protein [Deferribacteraceae bacterium]
VFAKPLNRQVSWHEAYKICNGIDYTGNPTVWKVDSGYVGGEKLPLMEQLQTVSMPGKKIRSLCNGRCHCRRMEAGLIPEWQSCYEKPRQLCKPDKWDQSRFRRQ